MNLVYLINDLKKRLARLEEAASTPGDTRLPLLAADVLTAAKAINKLLKEVA